MKSQIKDSEGNFIPSELSNEDGLWGSNILLKTIEVTLYFFGIIWLISYVLLKIFLPFQNLYESIIAALLSGTLVYLVFQWILAQGDGKIKHEVPVEKSEIYTVYIAPWLSNLKLKFAKSSFLSFFIERGGRLFQIYGPHISFRLPGTIKEGEINMKESIEIATKSEGKEIQKPFDVDLGTNQADDPLTLNARIVFRPSEKFFGIYYDAQRDNPNFKELLQLTGRGLINIAIDEVGKDYEKDDILGPDARKYYSKSEAMFLRLFEEAQKVDPLMRSVDIYSSLVLSGAKETQKTSAARSEAAAGEIIHAKARKIAHEIVTDSGGETPYKQALEEALVILKTIPKKIDQKILGVDSDSGMLITSVLKEILRGRGKL